MSRDRRNERYWTQFVDYLSEQGSQLQTGEAYNKSYLNFGIGTGFVVRAIARGKKISVKFVMQGVRATDYFDLLREDPAINTHFGGQLIWRGPEELERERQVVLEGIDTGTEDEDNWTYQHNWLAKNLENLVDVFSLRIPELHAARIR